jgi:hypothetical protein
MMSAFWRGWLNMWCVLVIAVGVVFAGGGLNATAGPSEILFGLLGGGAAFEWTPHLRVSVAVMGAVTIGWGLTFIPLFMAAHRLGDSAAPVWRLATLGVLAWFAVDSGLSIATGFWLNAVSNTGLMIGFLVPVLVSGAMGRAAR